MGRWLADAAVQPCCIFCDWLCGVSMPYAVRYMLLRWALMHLSPCCSIPGGRCCAEMEASPAWRLPPAWLLSNSLPHHLVLDPSW